MKIGAERNKVILLIVVSALAAFTVYVQFFAEQPPRPVRRQPLTAEKAAPNTLSRPPREATQPVQMRGQAFRPKFKRSDPGEPLDPMKIDPTLRTDLLAKVRTVDFQGVERNLFKFAERKKHVPLPSKETVEQAQKLVNNPPQPKPKTQARPPSKPKAPALKWKYYGFANAPNDGRKRAFLLDGEEILIGTEGDVFQKRYKIVSIGINSIVIEDLQFKDRQTLPLQET